jgi:hypothetical protein
MSKMVDLSDYTEEELVALNHRIVERLRSLQQHRCHKEMARFNLGDTVVSYSSRSWAGFPREILYAVVTATPTGFSGTVPKPIVTG